VTNDRSRLAVIGLGKLGSPMAACFAAKGFEVVGVDLNLDVVDAINAGRAPVLEPELQETMDRVDGRLRATPSTREAVEASDVVFLIVPTPSNEDGTFSLRFVLSACEEIGATLRDKEGFPVVVLTSTVMPGATGGAVRQALEQASGKQAGIDFGLCYSPEFIALGSVVRDFLNPDFLLIGESDERSGDALVAVYSDTVDNDAPAARMNFVNAELAKISVNTYVTTKIAFANMLARICERLPGADADVVADALGRDSRIGRKYLTGAIAYGGPCFPRDNVALAALGRSLGAPALLAEATDRANRDDLERLADLVEGHAGADGSIAVLGLSYKPFTNVIDESPGLMLAHELAERGRVVRAFDPVAGENARAGSVGLDIDFADSLDQAVEATDVIVITTPWPEFATISLEQLESHARRPVIIDCWRILDGSRFASVADYVALGSGAVFERGKTRV
jgi:UDPglucose 6-dehydrogenase